MLKKVKKGWGKNFSKQFENMLILLLIVGLVFICSYFWIAFHNVDLSFNIMRVTDAVNYAELYDVNGTEILLDFSEIMDKGSDFEKRPIEDYYISGINNLSLFFILGIIDALTLGLILSRRL